MIEQEYKIALGRLDEWMSFAFIAGLGDMIPLFVISLGVDAGRWSS